MATGASGLAEEYNGGGVGGYADGMGPGGGAADADEQQNGLTETLTGMNVNVLRQYEPSIRSILSVASSTVVYVLNYETGGWEKPEPQVEGTLFLCEQEPLVMGSFALPRACVFVLNRKGLSNVVVDLARVNMAEVTADLITLQIKDDAGSDGLHEPVLGLWIHGGTATRATQFNPNVVLECWQTIRSSLELALGTCDIVHTGPVLEAAETAAAVEMQAEGEDPVGRATRAIGGRPSIRELVATALGNGGGA